MSKQNSKKIQKNKKGFIGENPVNSRFRLILISSGVVVFATTAIIIFILSNKVPENHLNDPEKPATQSEAPGNPVPTGTQPQNQQPNPGIAQTTAKPQPTSGQSGFKPIDLSKIDPSQSPANDPNNPKVKRRESVQVVKDEKGQIIERKDDNFDQEGNVSMHNRYTYKYDEAGNMIEQRFYSHRPDGEQTANTVNFTKWNAQKLKTENLYIVYDANGKEVSRQKNTFKYNQYGQCTEDQSFDSNNKPVLKVEYIYQQGQLRGEKYTYYNPDGSVKNKESYQYDERGRLLNK